MLSREHQSRTCLLVLGMHRSGTSALTRVLSLLGAALPKELMGPGPGNEAGHWEPARLALYHDQLLAELDSRWDDWRRLELDRVPSRRLAEIRADIRSHIAADYRDAELIVLKEPRICRFAPLFLQALDEAGYDTRIVIPIRNPIEVIGSLEHRTTFWSDEHTRTTAALLWLRHALDAEAATRSRPRAILSYDALLDDWRGSLSRSETSLGLSWPYTVDAVEPLITRFLLSERRNHRATTEDVRLDPALKTWIADAYEALLVLERDPASNAALATLDRIRRTFDDAAPVMERLVAEQMARAEAAIADERNKAEATVTQERSRAEATALELATSQAERDARAADTEQVRTELAAAQAERDARVADAEQVRSELAAAQAERDARAADTEQMRTELAAAQAERDARAADAEQVRSELAAAQAERDARAAETERVRNELAGERQQHAEDLASVRQQAETDRAEGRELADQLNSLIEIAEKQISEMTDELRNLRATAAEASAALSAALAERDKAIAEIARLRAEVEAERMARDHMLAEQQAQAETVARELDSARQIAATDLASSQAEVARLKAATTQAREDALQNVAAAHALTLAVEDAYQRSTSWRLTAPIRGAKRTLLRSNASTVAPSARLAQSLTDQASQASRGLSLEPSPKSPASFPKPKQLDPVFFTICSRNFIAYARTLHVSLRRFYPNMRFFVALCDDATSCPPFDAHNEPFEVITLERLAIPGWREMSQRYNVTEFNTAIKPFVFQYLFAEMETESVIYFDPDIYVVDRLTELDHALLSGASAVLTPHMLEPAPAAEMNEKRLLQYGIYNLGFLAARNTPATRKLMDWWGNRLKTDCVIKRDEGLFVDQKWADHFPAFLPGTLILHHPGYNVAYWNLSSRKVKWTGSAWEVNGEPLRFVHFSGNDLDNPECLSRHSSEHTTYNVGHLTHLLDEYRRRIFEEGHNAYRAIPYAFSWEGAAGVNEHTPIPKFQQRSGATIEQQRQLVSATASVNYLPQSNARPVSTVNVLRTAVRMAGGPRNLALKTLKALRTGGISQVKSRIGQVRRRSESQFVEAAAERTSLLTWRKKVLFIEWSTPRPNQDSGSRTAFYFIEILMLLGYDVTFLPADMRHFGQYTHNVEEIGVTCVHGGMAGSVEAYLRHAGATFDFVVLNRVHVAAPLLGHVQTYCPQAKIIFNTVDLHYVRELRDAELAGAPPDMALATKQAELGLVAAAEETIVLSHVERDELVKELPDAKVCVLPLVFSDIDPMPPAHSARKDILFIGSFPHKPNVDAVLAFAKEVFPQLRAKRPDIVWHIVGSEPTQEVLALANEPGIVVHGFVEDLSPLFSSVRLSVAPLRFGAGIKGKIATSLSYGVPVVASPIAVEGMEITEGEQVCVAHDPDHWVETIVSLYDDEARWSRMSENGQALTVAQYSVSANALRVAEMMRRMDPDLGDMELFRFGSKREHDYLRSSFPEVVDKRVSRELALLPAGEEAFNIEGFCATCGAPHSFLTSYMYACENHSNGRLLPNWREHLACDSCGFTMRLRAAMHLYFSRYQPQCDASIYITEQATPLYIWLKSRHSNLQGSEYLGDKCALGQESGGYRNEDLTKLTFADASFDAILSFDVLEHVADDLAAFRECYRCLKPGGVLFFTAPFAFDKQDKVIRAELRPDGTINHILPPEIHGNPVDPDGALCFRYFGWDVLDDLKSVGFTSTEVLNYWSSSFAYLGKFGYVVVARKGTARG